MKIGQQTMLQDIKFADVRYLSGEARECGKEGDNNWGMPGGLTHSTPKRHCELGDERKAAWYLREWGY